jgi:hypothetical protein
MPDVALTKDRRVLIMGQLLYGVSVVAYLTDCFVWSHYGLPFKNGVITAGHVLIRVRTGRGDSTVLLLPWQADLFLFLEGIASLCLFGCLGVWYYRVRRQFPRRKNNA